MRTEQLEVKDVVLVKPKVFFDNRGYLYESYNYKTWDSLNLPNNFIQDNIAHNIKKNTIRGMHYQEKYYQLRV